MVRAKPLYARTQDYIITTFDVSDAKTAERLGKEIVTQRGRARLHALGPQAYALVIRPGGARRLAR